MVSQNIKEKSKELQSILEESNWNFRKYIDSEVGDSLLEKNRDTVIEILNAVRDFYATESLVLCSTEQSDVENFKERFKEETGTEDFKERFKEETGTEDFKEAISRTSELHDLLLKLEYIYVYKLKELIDKQYYSGNSESLYDFFVFSLRIEEIILLNSRVITDFWYDFFEDLYYFFSERWYFIRTFSYGFHDEVILEYLIDLTKFFSDWFSRHIEIVEKRMLQPDGILHFVNIENTKVFHKKFVKHLRLRLHLDTDLYNKAFENDKISCYATIDFNGKKYITVNGTNLKGKTKAFNVFAEVLTELYKTEGEIVKVDNISDRVRYYLKNEKDCIDYKKYNDFVTRNAEKKNNRMFTCCERKLFAKLREDLDREIKDIPKESNIYLATTKFPCLMCQRDKC